MSPDQFYRLTLRGLFREFVAGRERLDEEHDGRIWLAWHIAAWTHGSKGLPKLDRLLSSSRRPSRKQTAREQVAIWQTFAASVGGKFVPVTDANG